MVLKNSIIISWMWKIRIKPSIIFFLLMNLTENENEDMTNLHPSWEVAQKRVEAIILSRWVHCNLLLPSISTAVCFRLHLRQVSLRLRPLKLSRLALSLSLSISLSACVQTGLARRSRRRPAGPPSASQDTWGKEGPVWAVSHSSIRHRHVADGPAWPLRRWWKAWGSFRRSIGGWQPLPLPSTFRCSCASRMLLPPSNSSLRTPFQDTIFC